MADNAMSPEDRERLARGYAEVAHQLIRCADGLLTFAAEARHPYPPGTAIEPEVGPVAKVLESQAAALRRLHEDRP